MKQRLFGIKKNNKCWMCKRTAEEVTEVSEPGDHNFVTTIWGTKIPICNICASVIIEISSEE